jgi:hypothetical protein
MYRYIFPVMLGIFFVSTVPFAAKAIKKDLPVGLLSPVLLLLRSGAQFFGVIGGIIRKRNQPC